MSDSTPTGFPVILAADSIEQARAAAEVALAAIMPTGSVLYVGDEGDGTFEIVFDFNPVPAPERPTYVKVLREYADPTMITTHVAFAGCDRILAGDDARRPFSAVVVGQQTEAWHR